MPNESMHKVQILHNYDFVQRLQSEIQGKKFSDWLITSCFYTCVHSIEWYFAKEQNFHSLDHRSREDKIRRLDELEPIYRDYRDLSELSRSVRYDCVLNTLRLNRLTDSISTVEKITKHIKNLDGSFPTLPALIGSSSIN